jgi:hypothetical protein
MLDPRQEVLYDAWCQARAVQGAAPPRRSFDPIRFPQSLSTIILVERVAEGALCFRLVGTDMVDAWGGDFTGKHLHEIMQGEYHDFIRGLFDECIERRQAIFSHSKFQWDRGRVLDTKRLMLPYARNEAPEEIGFVMVSQVFDYSKIGPSRPKVSTDMEFSIVEVARERLQSSAGS